MRDRPTFTVAATQRFLELNVFNPIGIFDARRSCRLPAAVVASIAADVVPRLEQSREHIGENPAEPLMLVTALNPRIGYDKSVAIGKTVRAGNLAPKDAPAKLGSARTAGLDRRVMPGVTSSWT